MRAGACGRPRCASWTRVARTRRDLWAERWEPLPELRNLRVVGDASSVEVFANDGELCKSTRYYPRRYRVHVDAPGADATLWGLEA